MTEVWKATRNLLEIGFVGSVDTVQ